jgi:hypothetical protein
MTETRISKIIVRNGDVSLLPILDAAEFGYSTDENRLFIGNCEYTLGTGNSVQLIFALPNVAIPGNTLENPKFFVNGQERSDVVVSSSTVTFSAAPANNAVVTMKFNSELLMRNSAVRPSVLNFAAANQTYLKSGFFFDYTQIDVCFIDYSVKLDNGLGFNAGSLRIVINPNTQTFKIDDQYNQISSDVDIYYGGLIEGNTFHLTYLNDTVSTATFKYVFRLWNM